MLAIALTEVSPGLAMALGILIGAVPFFGEALRRIGAGLAKELLALAIVLLGLTLDIFRIGSTTLSTLGVTVLSIVAVVTLGVLLGRFFLKNETIGLLIGSGTAICGASAISAVGAAVGAGGSDMALALAVVLVFNLAALFLFPAVGHLLNLTPEQFGVWSGLAIHDTSSVVGAAAVYSPESLKVAAIVKLARAIWILPLAAIAARRFRVADGKGRSPSMPWFIWGFILASIIGSALKVDSDSAAGISWLVKGMMGAALFLLGAGLSWAQLKQLGLRALIVGSIVWAISLTLGLFFVL